MTPFSGMAYRVVFIGQDALSPVRSPEGRFHHSGQRAIYTSLTPEGCGVALKRYLGEADAARHIVPLAVSLDRVADLRGRPEACVIWQDARALAHPAPTWALSDKAREQGAQGMLYSSRSRPDLTHLVVFTDQPGALQPAAAPLPFPA